MAADKKVSKTDAQISMQNSATLERARLLAFNFRWPTNESAAVQEKSEDRAKVLARGGG